MPISSYGQSVSVSVTTSSAATALPDGRGGRAEVLNLGPGTVYARVGTSTTTVAAIDGTARQSVVIPPNCVVDLDCSSATHVALIGSAAATAIIMQGAA
jgi:hypothetical protein